MPFRVLTRLSNSGNPTVLGLAVFLVTLTPLSCYFMGFMGSTTDSALTLMGTLYFSAGLGLYLAAVLEWYGSRSRPMRLPLANRFSLIIG